MTDAVKARFDATVGSFISSTNNILQQYEERAQKSATLPSLDSAALPADLLTLFDEYADAKQQFKKELLDIVGYIDVRFPEIKEEDNAGVRVQEEVKQALTGLLYGGKDGKQDFEIDEIKFLQERAKLTAPEKEGKDGEKAATNEDVEKEKKIQLARLTRQQYRALELGWRNLQGQRLKVATFLQNNKDKLAEPRRSSSRYHN